MTQKKSLTCKRCDGDFSPKSEWQKFCSDSCRNMWHSERRREALKLLQEQEDVE